MVFDQLFADADALSAATLNTVFNSNTAQFGGEEDGWDAIEHTIAEYDFRQGAVPIIIMLQNDEGRATLNNTLTHAGVLSALRSKNAILNTIVVAPFETSIADPVFGVESPGEDGDGDDTTHTAYVKGTGAAFTSSVFDDDLHDINGADGDRTDKDYVELAWETGGAAWNVNVINDEFAAGTPNNDTMAAFFMAA